MNLEPAKNVESEFPTWGAGDFKLSMKLREVPGWAKPRHKNTISNRESRKSAKEVFLIGSSLSGFQTRPGVRYPAF